MSFFKRQIKRHLRKELIQRPLEHALIKHPLKAAILSFRSYPKARQASKVSTTSKVKKAPKQ